LLSNGIAGNSPVSASQEANTIFPHLKRRRFLRFDEVEKGCNMYVASENKMLVGGGIHAEIIVALMESFRVIDGLVMKL
jgi:hypothetical protein